MKLKKLQTNSHLMKSKKTKGFTLIEIIVSIGIFAAVMLIAIGSLISIQDANRKAQALRITMDNLNFALENIVREMRTGYNYNGSSCFSAKDCISFLNSKGQSISYSLESNQIKKNVNGKKVAITSPNIKITDLSFYIKGEGVGDGLQPRVLISVQGVSGIKAKVKTDFILQTTVSQRKIDS